jgi:hypothetical protein
MIHKITTSELTIKIAEPSGYGDTIYVLAVELMS